MNPASPVMLRRPSPEDAEELIRMVDELNLHEGDATGNLSTERALADIIAPDAPVSSLVAE